MRVRTRLSCAHPKIMDATTTHTHTHTDAADDDDLIQRSREAARKLFSGYLMRRCVGRAEVGGEGKVCVLFAILEIAKRG